MLSSLPYLLGYSISVDLSQTTEMQCKIMPCFDIMHNTPWLKHMQNI